MLTSHDLYRLAVAGTRSSRMSVPIHLAGCDISLGRRLQAIVHAGQFL